MCFLCSSSGQGRWNDHPGHPSTSTCPMTQATGLPFSITPYESETNPSFSKQSKYIHSWGQQSPGLTKVLLLFPVLNTGKNVTNPIWIFRVNGHREVFRQTKVGATATVPHSTSLKFLSSFCYFILWKWKSPLLWVFQILYSPQPPFYQLWSAVTHIIFLPVITVGILPFPDSNLYFPLILTLDEKATRMYIVLHKNLKGNAVENC